MPRRTDADARATRLSILRRAADIGSVEGLRAITIGRLANDLGMSKAGVVGRFGSKEALQLATVELAAEMFDDAVWAPAVHEPAGLPRLLAICHSWTAYLADPPFAGGCFLALTSVEYAAQTGQVHDALAGVLVAWRRKLLRDLRQAIADGDLPPACDPEQLVFVLESIAAGARGAQQVHGDRDVRHRCLVAMLTTLGCDATAWSADLDPAG